MVDFQTFFVQILDETGITWYKYFIFITKYKKNGRGAKLKSTQIQRLGKPDVAKGCFAEKEHLPGCLLWAVTEYVPDCHKCGVLSSWNSRFAMYESVV